MRIALYQGISLISRLIRWQTRSKYSHAAFLLDDDSVIEAWTPCVRHVKSLSAQHTPGTRVDIFSHAEPLSLAAQHRLLCLLQDDIGIPYDYQAIFRFLTRQRPPHWIRRRLFCSEQVFQRCQSIGRPLLFRTEAWRVPPDWLARSPVLYLQETIVTT
jgi:hypothetical protein